MGDNLGPSGLSRGCKVICSGVDATDAEGIGFSALRGDAFKARAFCSARACAVNPARRRGAPLRASGVDRASAAKPGPTMPGMKKSASRSGGLRRSGDIGDCLWAERVVEGLQGLLLEVEVSEIVVHEADEPDAVVDFLDAELLAGQHGRDVDLLAMQAEPSAIGDENVAVVERIGQLGQAVIAAR